MENKNHPRNQFQIERIVFFSDAVFAIAITLLIIEIHPPLVVKNDTDQSVWNKLYEKIPEFLGLIASFWLIGSSWLRHHQLFKYVDSFDMKLMLLNFWLLFTIILFPFSTSFLFNTLFDNIVTKPQVYFYLFVPLLSALFLYFMFRHVRNKHTESVNDSKLQNAVIYQSLMILSCALAIIWVIIIPIRFHFIGYAFLAVGPVLFRIFRRK